jgi:hypothetical protein
LLHQAVVLQGPGDGHQQFLVFKGLEDVVEGAGLHGGHRLFHGAEGGHHDHRQVRVEAFDLPQQFDAVHLGHLHVGEDEVHIVVGGELQGLLPPRRGEHLIALLSQEGLHDREVIDFVVDY